MSTPPIPSDGLAAHVVPLREHALRKSTTPSIFLGYSSCFMHTFNTLATDRLRSRDVVECHFGRQAPATCTINYAYESRPCNECGCYTVSRHASEGFHWCDSCGAENGKEINSRDCNSNNPDKAQDKTVRGDVYYTPIHKYAGKGTRMALSVGDVRQEHDEPRLMTQVPKALLNAQRRCNRTADKLVEVSAETGAMQTFIGKCNRSFHKHLLLNRHLVFPESLKERVVNAIRNLVERGHRHGKSCPGWNKSNCLFPVSHWNPQALSSVAYQLVIKQTIEQRKSGQTDTTDGCGDNDQLEAHTRYIDLRQTALKLLVLQAETLIMVPRVDNCCPCKRTSYRNQIVQSDTDDSSSLCSKTTDRSTSTGTNRSTSSLLQHSFELLNTSNLAQFENISQEGTIQRNPSCNSLESTTTPILESIGRHDILKALLHLQQTGQVTVQQARLVQQQLDEQNHKYVEEINRIHASSTDACLNDTIRKKCSLEQVCRSSYQFPDSPSKRSKM